MTEAKAIRNSVEGRDVPRGPSATELHTRAIRTAIDRASKWDSPSPPTVNPAGAPVVVVES